LKVTNFSWIEGSKSFSLRNIVSGSSLDDHHYIVLADYYGQSAINHLRTDRLSITMPIRLNGNTLISSKLALPLINGNYDLQGTSFLFQPNSVEHVNFTSEAISKDIILEYTLEFRPCS
jgi:hypothetical protein